jgi:hypothetical protein
MYERRNFKSKGDDTNMMFKTIYMQFVYLVFVLRIYVDFNV